MLKNTEDKVKKLIQNCLLILFSLTFIPQASSDIFQCIDSSGNTTFQDSECLEDKLPISTPTLESLNKKLRTDHLEKQQKSRKSNNLLINGSFKEGLLGWTKSAGAYWSSDGGLERSAALFIQAEKPPEDKYIYETEVSQCVQIEDGEEFTLVAEFREEATIRAAQGNRMTLSWYDSIDCSVGGEFDRSFVPKDSAGWQPLLAKGLKPTLNAKAAKISLMQNGRNSMGNKGYWDNISFTPTAFKRKSLEELETVPIGVNILENGAFEKDTFSWRLGLKTRWHPDGHDAEGSLTLISLVSTQTMHSHKVATQCVHFGSNKNFELGVSTKREQASTNAGNVSVHVTWFENRYCHGRHKTSNQIHSDEGINGWQNLHLPNLHAPPNAKSAQVVIMQLTSGSGRFVDYFDDAYLKATE